MHYTKIILFIITAAVLNVSHAQEYSYHYTGPYFLEFFSSYSGDDRVTGYFRTEDKIPSNMPFASIASSVQSYRFTDGNQVLTEENSTIIVFDIGTDESGQPMSWDIKLWAAPVTTVIGEPVQGIHMFYNADMTDLIFDLGFMDGKCINNNSPGNQCTLVSRDQTNSGNFQVSNTIAETGSWFGSQIRMVPVFNIYVLLIFITAIFLCTFIFTNKKT